MKKHGFSITIPRLFTRGEHAAYELIHFQEPEQAGDDSTPALECPDNWGTEAASLLAEEAACRTIPAQTKAIEENTVPSWLWRRSGEGRGTTEETSAKQIFDRVVGAASYTGWKQGLFRDEADAQVFYDEARYALMQRFIALEPKQLAVLGLNWAYGSKKLARQPLKKINASEFTVQNQTIDTIMRGSAGKADRAKWQKLLTPKTKASSVTLRFTDITTDWGTATTQGPRATLDLMMFRHNDGTMNIDKLRHATKLLVILLDLQDDQSLGTIAIGFNNLAPLLMALALPYDSNGARTMAAAISAIITAEAYATSAELAGLRGPSTVFTAARESVLRALRNYRRTVYGDRNDYEKISVLPVPLALENCPDLGLVAAAQRGWDQALASVRNHGLRHIQVTALSASPTLTLFMESITQGTEGMSSLMITRQPEAENFQREIHPSVIEALLRLHYSRADNKAITHYIAGSHTLEKAPAINHAALIAHGFDETAIDCVEQYLPNVSDIRLAFTPWIIGEDFCRKVLKVPATKLQNPHFDLLKHLGFSALDSAAANAFYYGHDTVKGAKPMRAQQAAVFARANDITADAQIRMAASVQSFISGAVEAYVSLPTNMTNEKKEQLALGAWRQGMKSLTMRFDAAPAPLVSEKRAKTSMAAFLHTQSPSLPARKSRLKAGSRLVSMKRSHEPKAVGKSRGK